MVLIWLSPFGKPFEKLMKITWHSLETLEDLPPEARARLFRKADTPFNRFEFLHALESSGCVTLQTGWRPFHQILKIDEQIRGILICYQKFHSYGEYIFDWSWAEAHHRHQVPYYPKLSIAIPFTPVPCSKWLTDSHITELEAVSLLREREAEKGVSGIHHLYSQGEQTDWENAGWIYREGLQFHWFNRPSSSHALYHDFDDYLQEMTARKRKSIKKERRRVQQQGINCLWRSGSEVGSDELEAFYQFYQLTYYKRGQQGYLNFAFFQTLLLTMPEQIRLLVCYQGAKIVGSALYFVSDDTLYGRYWGALPQQDLLHFEACYYQGIEFAIGHRLNSFNPGTQGEHKIQRGFIPTLTYSNHHLYSAPFHQAIARFCREEKLFNRAYMKECRERLPFKA